MSREFSPAPTDNAIPSAKTLLLAAAALIAFAGNSLLNRAALADGTMDASAFTIIRLVAGAIMLLALLARRRGGGAAIFEPRQWRGGMALFAYAALFSFAYLDMEAGTGALILFATVQLTMQAIAMLRGERPGGLQWIGLALALAGLVWLLGPGASPPPVWATIMMIGSGAAWGIYSVMGFSGAPPVDATRQNFIWGALLSLLLLPFVSWNAVTTDGIMLAVMAGALTSALGYVIWYAALPGLGAATAAVGQLMVPSIAAMGGVLLLNELLTMRLILASLLILGGIALTLRRAKA